MSTISSLNHIHNPEMQTGIFNGHPHPFWVGRLALADYVDRDKIFEAAAQFRGKTYLQLGYVSPEQVDELGREVDADDARSIHFSVIERSAVAGPESSRIIGTSRLILKDSDHNKLPIERYFPEIFQDTAANVGSVEVSRLISNHENPRVQHGAALSLIRAMTHYSIKRKIEADYCMVEGQLLRFLNSSGIPTEILGAEKRIPEQNGVLYPVKIEPAKIIENVTSNSIGKTALKKFFLDGTQNQGEGFYDESFLKD